MKDFLQGFFTNATAYLQKTYACHNAVTMFFRCKNIVDMLKRITILLTSPTDGTQTSANTRAMAMSFGLAQRYLMQALAMKRKNLKRLKERINEGKCILDGCDRCYVSRGLCDSHRQAFYNALKAKDGQEAKLEFEQDQIRDGFILADGEQGKWTTKNPFLKSASA